MTALSLVAVIEAQLCILHSDYLFPPGLFQTLLSCYCSIKGRAGTNPLVHVQIFEGPVMQWLSWNAVPKSIHVV